MDIQKFFGEIRDFEKSGFLSVASAVGSKDGFGKIILSAANKSVVVEVKPNGTVVKSSDGLGIVLKGNAQNYTFNCVMHAISSGTIHTNGVDYENVVVYPCGIVNSSIVFSDFNGRRFISSSSDVPYLTLKYYDVMRLKKKGYSILPLTQMYREPGSEIKRIGSSVRTAEVSSKDLEVLTSKMMFKYGYPILSSKDYRNYDTISFGGSIRPYDYPSEVKIWNALMSSFGKMGDSRVFNQRSVLNSSRSLTVLRDKNSLYGVSTVNNCGEVCSSVYLLDEKKVAAPIYSAGVRVYDINNGDSVSFKDSDLGYSYSDMVKQIDSTGVVKVSSKSLKVESSLFKFSGTKWVSEHGERVTSSQLMEFKDCGVDLCSRVAVIKL